LVLGWATHMLLSLGAAPPRAQASAAASATNSRPDAGTVPIASPAAALPSASPAPTAGRVAVTSLAAPSPPVKPVSASAGDVPDRKPVAPAQGELARERFEATQAWLRNTPGDWYAIQLATVNASALPQLEDFLRKAATALPGGELLVYSVKIDGQQHYRVAYGSYPSAAKALEAMKGLPQLLAAYQPYARSVERMRSQNRQ